MLLLVKGIGDDSSFFNNISSSSGGSLISDLSITTGGNSSVLQPCQRSVLPPRSVPLSGLDTSKSWLRR